LIVNAPDPPHSPPSSFHGIDYRDDTGFTADGEFRGGVLHHGGMVLRRKEEQQSGSYQLCSCLRRYYVG
jgi:Agrobacterium tumefaciens protein Atu4866